MVQTTIRVPKKLYELLKRKAKECGMSLNGYLLKIIWDYLN